MPNPLRSSFQGKYLTCQKKTFFESKIQLSPLCETTPTIPPPTSNCVLVRKNFQHYFSLVFNYLSSEDKRQLGCTNQKWYKFFRNNNGSKNNRYYYAVGNNIPLRETVTVKKYRRQHSIAPYKNSYSYTCSYSHSYTKFKNKFSSEELHSSLGSGNFSLFLQYDDAINFANFSASQYYDSSDDLFWISAIAPIFIVQLKRVDIYALRETVKKVVEHIPPCPWPPKPQVKHFSLVITRPANIVKAYYASINGKIYVMPSSFNDKWRELWNKEKTLNDAIVSVFKSYFIWHSSFTRSHETDVREIITQAKLKTSDLVQFVKKKYAQAIENLESDSKKDFKVNSKINKEGTYFKMLQFIMTKINIESLPQVNKYFKRNK